MPGKLTKTIIKERTEQYWDKFRGDYDCYVKELLGRELNLARADPLGDGTPRLRLLDKCVHTLALTVGESFEPLLQVTCVLRPKRIVLILNNSYSGTPGKDHGETLKKLMESLTQVSDLPDDMRPSLSDNDFDLIELGADTPTQVFRALRCAMQKRAAQPPEGYVNAVDITGAKKSMVVGAFLYAAHSGLRITYVDFDNDAYNSYWSKLYGFKCKIGEIPNPYEAFRLREWEQVRQLYNSYNFRGARIWLGKAKNSDDAGTGILGAMSGVLDRFEHEKSLYEDADIKQAERLAQAMEMYEAWENGDYVRAKSLLDGFDPSLPPDVAPFGVKELGNDWPSASTIPGARDAAQHLLSSHLELKHGQTAPSDSLFARPLHLLAYVREERAKVRRLSEKNEDYRSAYMRAAGLHEFLLKARLALCWLNNALEAKPKGSGSWQPVTAFGLSEHAAFGSLMDESSEWKFRRALRAGSQEEMNVTAGSIRRTATAPDLKPYFDGLPFDLNAAVHTDSSGNTTPLFVKLRGEAVHTHLYIPKHVAEAAIELVAAAVDEFETNWLRHFHPDVLQQAEGKWVEAPPWNRLCEVFRLEFLPLMLCES